MSIRLLNLKSRVEDDPDGPADEELRKNIGGPGDYKLLKNESGEPPKKSSSSITDLDDEKSVSSDSLISLHQAASEGSIDLVKRFFAELQDSNDPNNHDRVARERDKFNAQGFSALHLAARYNRKNVVAYLLDIGAPIDGVDGEDKNTPLLLASKYNMKLSAKLLLQRNANPKIQNKYGTTPLHFAARRGNEDLCKLLLDKKDVDINATDNGLTNPLHMAMLGGSEAVAKLLIDSGANVNAMDVAGETPIHYAAAEDAGDLIVLLAKGALRGSKEAERKKIQKQFVNAASYEKDTALHIAAQAGYEETVKTLITIGADVNLRTDTHQTALHLAAISGQTAVVRFLVLHNAKVNAPDAEQMTPLHRACQYGRLETIRFLKERGARLDAKDKDNFTPLMCAVWKGQNEVVKYLLEEGANIKLTDLHNKTVLHLAIEENHYDTLDLLMQRGGTQLVPKTDKDFKTPLHYAAAMGNEPALKLLINNEAELDLGDYEEKTPLHNAAENGHLDCVLIIGKAAPGIINSTDERGRSPLHLAAIKGHIYVTASLIEMGAETSCRDEVNWTPLDYAARHGYPKTLKVLLDNDADVDACDKNDSTPLQHASQHGNVSCITLLLDNGASIHLRNRDGKNCLDLAVENFERDACRALIKHKRWHEVVHNVDNNGVHPLEKLIEVAPDVAEMVLNNCIEYSKESKDHPSYYIKYKFHLLDLPPTQQKKDIYFGPSTMVRFQRENLLRHPLTVKLINDKWCRLGRWIYMCSLTVYLLFVSLLTALVVIEKQDQKDLIEANNKISNSTMTSLLTLTTCHDLSGFSIVVPWLTLALACFQIFKELTQAICLGRRYLWDPVNWFEFMLYSATFLFMLPFILCQVDSSLITHDLERMKWQAGAVSILFAWFNLLLYLKRFPFFGLYVVMFTEIFGTLVNVLLVFSILIVGFALSFYSLVNVQADFKMPGRSIVRTSVMMIGELDYDSMFTAHFPHKNNANLPYKEMTVFIFIFFLIIMSIIVMNLLVGLAVGDIESVRKNAYLRILEAQVRILKVLERTYPTFILNRVYKDHAKVIPNKRNVYRKFMDWVGKFNSDALIDEQREMGGMEELIMREVESQRHELEKQKEKMKSLITMIEEHCERTRRIARKLEVTDLES